MYHVKNEPRPKFRTASDKHKAYIQGYCNRAGGTYTTIVNTNKNASLTVGVVSAVILQPSSVTRPSRGMSRVILLCSNLGHQVAFSVENWP